MEDCQQPNQELRDKQIVLLASAPFESFGPLNCHHIAHNLAIHNDVIFIESPGLRKPKLFKASDFKRIVKRLCNRLFGNRPKASSLANDRLSLLSPLIIPAAKWRFTKAVNRLILQRAVKRAMQRLNWDNAILWNFLPIGDDLIDMKEFSFSIYHCVDNYAANPGVNSADIDRRQKKLVANSDLCFATSKPLMLLLTTDAGDTGTDSAKIHYMPNVASIEMFEECSKPVTELEEIPHPRLGYVGNIAAYKVDISLLQSLANYNKNWQIILVGPVGQGDPSTQCSELLALENVHHFPSCSHQYIPGWINGFDVCLIPFTLSPVTHSSFPLKTLEYLASNKEIVSRPLRSLTQSEAAEFIHFGDSHQDFTRAVEQALESEYPKNESARRAFCARNSWKTRHQEIGDLVSKMLDHSLEVT